MTQNNYDQIADQTIRDFVKAVVLIDDHWSETDNLATSEITADQINFEAEAIVPGTSEQHNEIHTGETYTDTQESLQVTDPAYLRDIGTKISNEGFLFTGFPYTDSRKDTALSLASKCDVLILDWNLGSGNCTPSLELLNTLRNSGIPRFVFILTDEPNLDGVREKISTHLGEETVGTDLVFSCGPFSFSLKNKPQAGGQNTVNAGEVLAEAFLGIQQRFGGLLQLAVLEKLGSYKKSLHSISSHFNEELDVPFVGEWLEPDSPIKNDAYINSLIMDEWQCMATQVHGQSRILCDETIKAFLIKQPRHDHDETEFRTHLDSCLSDKGKEKLPADAGFSNLASELKDWLNAGELSWPKSLSAKKNKKWNKSETRLLTLAYLSSRTCEKSTIINRLIDFDAFFHSQQTLPITLEQGSVIQIDNGSNCLVCITPSCDCERPKRINWCYNFLSAQFIELKNLSDISEDVLITVRRKGFEARFLKVEEKTTISLQITTHDGQLVSRDPLSQNDPSPNIKIIGKLRPNRIQALVSIAAANAISVGLDRSEIIRQLCK